MSLVKADMPRRSGKIDELINEYENKQYSKTLLNEILTFEIEKAKDKDRACYTVADCQGNNSCDCAEKGKEAIISKRKRLPHKENDSFLKNMQKKGTAALPKRAKRLFFNTQKPPPHVISGLFGQRKRTLIFYQY